ncbi:MAG: glycosyltransferase family 39 protein [Pseudomonadota bacterium]
MFSQFKWNKETFLLLSSVFAVLLIAFYPFHYGYFCDELYYIALSKNIAFGYVDVPPLMPFCLAIVRYLFGESLFAIHILPALLGIVSLVIVQKTVKKMGGTFFAQSLALIAFLLAPINVSHFSLLTYDSFNSVFWMLAIYSLVLLLLSDNKRYWIYFGIAAGFGLLSKFDMLWLGAGVAIALLFTTERKYFASRSFWLAGMIALLIASPYFIWIATHDFVTIQYFMGYSKALSRDGSFALWPFVRNQIILMNPLTLPLWLLGLSYFLFNRQGRRFRLIGLTYLCVFALNLVTHAKFYLIAPFYFVLLAGGAVYFEKFWTMRWSKVFKITYLIALFASGLLLIPYVRPVLSPTRATQYMQWIEQMGLAISYDKSETLPQWFADAFGWEEMTREVARIYSALPASEKNKTVLFTRSYSQASALYFYGEAYALPIPISGHDQYYVWGPRDLKRGFNMMIVGCDPATVEAIRPAFKSMSVVGRTENKYTMPYNNQPIYLALDLQQPVATFWKQRKALTM